MATNRLVLIRHGQTEWSQTLRHTGRTDLPLTPEGERLVVAAADRIAAYRFVRVLSSPLQRARRTAELLQLPGVEVDERLAEWDYGGYEGLTAAQISERLGRPWNIWSDGVVPGAAPLGQPESAPGSATGSAPWPATGSTPGSATGSAPGETLEDVAARVRGVVDRVTPDLERGDVALVAHGHSLRVLTSVWLGASPRLGSQLTLDPGGLCVLGIENGTRAIVRWNIATAS